MPKQGVLFIGPPGSGKGTQADELGEVGFFHLESSKVIETAIAEGLARDPKDSIFLREQKRWRAGKLNTPELVLAWIKAAATEIAKQGKSIVFSGSPRTRFEAAGSEAWPWYRRFSHWLTRGERIPGLVEHLENLYGAENIHVFNLDASEDECVRRNLGRRICKANRHTIPSATEAERQLTQCPLDGSELIKRAVDSDEKKIRFRHQVYRKLTVPVFPCFEKRGHRVIHIDGDNSIETVHHRLVDIIDRHRLPPA